MLVPLIIVGGSLCAAVAALVIARQRRRPALPATVACPHCGQNFGGKDLEAVDTITYRWTLARGFTLAQMNLPRLTFLTACPHCATEFEFTLPEPPSCIPRPAF